MAQSYLRAYQGYDIEEVKKHLLILGDLSADCAACRHLGIDAAQTKTCPECGTEFRYLTSRRIENHPSERFQIVRRWREQRPDLPFLDFTDYSKTLGRKQARDFFG